MTSIQEDIRICPCCGREIDPSTLETVTQRLALAGLSPQQRKIADFISSRTAAGRLPASLTDIIQEVYWDSEDLPKNPDMTIRVTISKMRTKLARVGLVVTGEGGTWHHPKKYRIAMRKTGRSS